ncbi:MAG: hypothetical protein OEZ25_03160, partial [Candidatus Bathyarchaeota archaeon]|nr:hypothetical protein [Candidatus Bathyarchaeota archaeon]
ILPAYLRSTDIEAYLELNGHMGMNFYVYLEEIRIVLLQLQLVILAIQDYLIMALLPVLYLKMNLG